jgi:hypothetical protein
MTSQRTKERPVNYRQATAAQLALENPIPPVGQAVREKDTTKWKFGDGVNHYNDLAYAVDVTAPVAVAAVTGATTVDGSLGSVFYLSLTGNVTGFTFSNLVVGKRYEIHFIQDATGSRTLAVNATVVKLAGGALTLTTTASKRDVLQFRAISSSVVVEIGRTLNI